MAAAARNRSASLRHVLAAFAQRRQAQAHDVEAVQQVGAEAAVGDQRLQVLVGRGDHAHVDADQLAAADAEELALGQHAQQPRLQRQRHVADLVEEQGAAVGLLEAAEVAPLRAGERAGLVAEQLAFQQFGRDRRGVERDERLCGARRFAVQRARDQFLAGAGLAGDQHRQRRLREAADRAEQRRASPACRRPAHRRRARPAAQRRAASSAAARGAERARGERDRIVEVERLGQELVRAAAERAGGAGDVGVGAHHDHRQLRRARLELVEQHQAVVAGHAHVGEHQVGRAAFGQGAPSASAALPKSSTR